MSNESDDAQPVRIYLREWRKHFDLTGEQVAERMGIEAPALYRIESGLQDWKSSFLAGAANALNVKPADLLRDPGD